MNRFDNVIFGQKAFIINNKKQILILKRKGGEVYDNFWDVPGGKLEKGDSLKEALARELFEETNLKLKNIILTISSHVFEGKAGDKPIIFRNIYLCSASGKVKLSIEHSEYKWINIEDFKDYNFPGDTDFQLALTKFPKLISKLNLKIPLSEAI